MGIDTSIRLLLKQRNPNTFQPFPPPFFETGGYVVIDDVLTRFRRLRSPNNNGLFTGDELLKEFMRPVLYHMRAGAAAYVAICDDFTNVPQQKHAEQARRSAGNNRAPPYTPADYMLSSAGIVNMDDPTHQYKAMPINLESLLNTRTLRVRLWQYIKRRLVEVKTTEYINNFQIVFEYEKAGPELLPDTYDWPASWKQPHNHGEADMSMVYWAHKYHDKPVVISTIDTDILPIAFNYIARKQRQMPLWWQYEDQKSHQLLFVDMLMVYKKLNMPSNVFCLACIIAGNDYVEKKPMAHRFNAELIVRAAASAWQQQLIGEDWRKPVTIIMGVIATLALLYGDRYDYKELKKITKDNLLQHWGFIRSHASQQDRNLLVPHDDDQLAKVIKIVIWNCQYWKTSSLIPEAAMLAIAV
jgi:hypothetical protein